MYAALRLALLNIVKIRKFLSKKRKEKEKYQII